VSFALLPEGEFATSDGNGEVEISGGCRRSVYIEHHCREGRLIGLYCLSREDSSERVGADLDKFVGLLGAINQCNIVTIHTGGETEIAGVLDLEYPNHVCVITITVIHT